MLALCAMSRATISLAASRSHDNGALHSNDAFVDAKTGAKHAWSVNEQHALLWASEPYLPIGGTFTPRSLEDTSDAAWHQDVTALATLRSHGIVDLIVWPTRPLPDIPRQAMQRLIDELDDQGFHYGLSFGPGIEQPVRGYVIRPSVYRFEDSTGITALWQTTDADAAAYFTVDADKLSTLVRKGMATVRNNEASAPVDVPADVGRPITLLVPREAPAAVPQGVLPDVWTDFDGYRDSLMAWFAHLKFGDGLRFFMDPLARNLALTDETSFLVPDSSAFQLEWESFLSRKYGGIDEVREKWLLSDEFKSMQELSRLVPLWSRDRGFPYLYDPTTGKTFHTGQTDAIRSSWWDDFTECRDGGLRFLLNSMADLLKRKVADVPVVYSSLRGNQTFTIADPDAGFDGLAVTTPAQDPSRLARVTGPGFSQIATNARRLWYIGRILGSTESGTTEATAGYSTSRQLETDLTDLRLMGVKGLFVCGFQPPQADRGICGDWLTEAPALDWLHSYGATINANAAAAGQASHLLPHILYYPESAPGPAHIGMVPGGSGTVWLPTPLAGRPLDWWPSFAGYGLQLAPNNEVTVLMSLQGPRKVDFMVQYPNKIHATTPGGSDVLIKVVNKTQIQVIFGREPIVFKTGGQELVPVQAAADALIQLDILARLAHQAKAQDSAYSSVELQEAASLYKARNYSGAFAAARQQIDTLMADSDVAPYVWLEGESTPFHNFSEVAPNTEASGGGFLRLSTPNPCSRTPHVYAARYAFSVPQDTDYDIWMAGTPPGPTTSPFAWYLDRSQAQDPADPKPQGLLYLSDRFGWMRLGTLRLNKGQHALTIKVTGRAAATHLFSLSVDALMIAPTLRKFVPDTTLRPIPVNPVTAKDLMKKARTDAMRHTGPPPTDSPHDFGE